MNYKYNLHNILSIKSDINLGINCLEVSEDLGKYDLIIKEAKYKSIDKSKYQQISHGLYYLKEEESIASELNILGIKIIWEVKNILKENTELRYSHSYWFASKYFLKVPISSAHRFLPLIKMIIQIKLLLKNYSFLAGGAVALKNRGVIFTGISASGKTTTLINFMNNFAAKFISDDLLILSKDEAYSYPSTIPIRRYNFAFISFNKLINPLEKFKGKVLTSIKSTFDIYFLEKSSSRYIKNISRSEGINKLCNLNNKVLLYFHERVLSSFPYLYEELSLLNLQEKQLGILSEFFQDANFYIMSASDINDYTKMLKDRY